MESFTALPNFSLRPAGDVTTAFRALDIVDFHGAARYVHQLPYGRTSDRGNFRLVLREGRGTCSAKHALLAELAHEQGVEVTLTLGIYQMTEHNTPGVGAILESYNLDYLPEAHCYLTYRGKRIDVTRAGAEPAEPIAHFLIEKPIVPAQIGAYKVALHQRYLRQWLTQTTHVACYSFDEVWQIREACIAALGQE